MTSNEQGRRRDETGDGEQLRSSGKRLSRHHPRYIGIERPAHDTRQPRGALGEHHSSGVTLESVIDGLSGPPVEGGDGCRTGGERGGRASHRSDWWSCVR